jgi:hypothetical protein
MGEPRSDPQRAVDSRDTRPAEENRAVPARPAGRRIRGDRRARQEGAAWPGSLLQGFDRGRALIMDGDPR